MLADRQPVTVRGLAQAVGTSTMAVYTYFDGIPGLWRAVRQEGFNRLAARLALVPDTPDPVHDLAALSAAYAASALTDPALYRTMFDAAADLEQPAVADASFSALIAGATRARAGGRFAPATDPFAVATRVWASGHGLLMLVVTGVLPPDVVAQHAPATAQALFVAAGDDEDRCRRSVAAGWASISVPSPPASG